MRRKQTTTSNIELCLLIMSTFFSKRKIRNNIVIRLYKTVVPIILIVPFFLAFAPQKGSTNPRKVEKMQAKKAKQARAKYEKDLNQHMKNQSKETRAMMKKARKNQQKTSPVKPTSKKKCP